MADILPPAPVDAPFTSYNWTDWYEKVRRAINDTGTITWSQINNFTGSNLNQLAVRSHASLQNLNANDHPQYQLGTAKDAANGYAGLNSASRVTKGVDTTDDVIIDLATKGLVLKDTQGTPHYWRITISNLGALVITDLGTTKP